MFVEIVEALFKATPAKYAHIDFVPPLAVQEAARRGLELRREHGRGGLSTSQAGALKIGSGVQRASDLANGERVSPRTAKRMRAFFARHSAYKEHHSDKTSPAYISWLLWGGDAGERWAQKITAQMARADEVMQKGGERAGHKYTRRVAYQKDGKTRYRYYYGSPKAKESAPQEIPSTATTDPSQHDETWEGIAAAPVGETEPSGAPPEVEQGIDGVSEALGADPVTKPLADALNNVTPKKGKQRHLTKAEVGKAISLMLLSIAAEVYLTARIGTEAPDPINADRVRSWANDKMNKLSKDVQGRAKRKLSAALGNDAPKSDEPKSDEPKSDEEAR